MPLCAAGSFYAAMCGWQLLCRCARLAAFMPLCAAGSFYAAMRGWHQETVPSGFLDLPAVGALPRTPNVCPWLPNAC